MKSPTSILRHSIAALLHDRLKLIVASIITAITILSLISAIASINSMLRSLSAEIDTEFMSLQTSIENIFDHMLDEMKTESAGPLMINAMGNFESNVNMIRPQLAAVAQQQFINYILLQDGLSQTLASAGKNHPSAVSLESAKLKSKEAIAKGKITLSLLEKNQATLTAPVAHLSADQPNGALIAWLDLEAIRTRATRTYNHHHHDVVISYSKTMPLLLTNKPSVVDLLSFSKAKFARNFPLHEPLNDYSVTIEHFSDLSALKLALAHIVAIHLIIIALALTGFSLIAKWIRKTYVIPVRQITSIAKNMGNRNQGAPPAIDHDSIRELRQAVTQMLDAATTSEDKHLEKINQAFADLDQARDHIEEIAINAGVLAISIQMSNGRIIYAPKSLGLAFENNKIIEGAHWKCLYSAFSPSQRKLIRIAVRESFRTGKSSVDVKIDIRPHSKVYHVRIRTYFESDVLKSRIDLIALDNTEKFKIEQALINSESRKAALINGAIDGLMTLNMDYVITEMNPAAERIFMRTNIKLLGQSFITNCIAPGLSQQFMKFIDMIEIGANLNTQVCPSPIWCITGESKLIPVELSASIVNADSGKQIVIYLKNLEEIHLKEMEIARKKSLIGAIFEMSPDGLVAFDEEEKLSTINKALLDMMDVQKDKLHIGLSHAEFRALLDSSSINQSIKRFTKNFSTEEGIISLHAPKPRLLKYFKKNPAGFNNKNSCVYYFKDITKEFQLDSMKSSFLETAAHELRTPLTTILGFSEFLFTNDAPPEEQKELLGNIYRQSINLSLLLNDLLDLAKIEAEGANLLKASEYSLRELLIEIYLGSTKARNNKRYIEKHELMLQLDEGEPLMALIDAEKIRRAILNLVNNATKYSSAESPITIVATSITATEPYVMISVIDKGIGMTNDELDHAFERFWRADSNSGNILGTGLGLPLVREIMNMHKGHILLHSTYGSGTTATLTIPVSGASACV